VAGGEDADAAQDPRTESKADGSDAHQFREGEVRDAIVDSHRRPEEDQDVTDR
jgi:hypothetical protein